MFEDRIGAANDKVNYHVQDEKRTYTVDEIQNILGICRSTAYELVKKNEFKSINIGRHIRISKKSFDEWLDHQI